MSKDIVVGIDISGKFMDIHILPEGMAKRFANDASGISEAVELARELEASLVVMESTGGLEVALVAECALSGLPSVVMNPRSDKGLRALCGQAR